MPRSHITSIESCHYTSSAMGENQEDFDIDSSSLTLNDQIRSAQPSPEFTEKCIQSVHSSAPEKEEALSPEEFLDSIEDESESHEGDISTAEPNLDTLPKELVTLIQSYLDPESNHALSQTCKNLRNNPEDPIFALRLRLERGERMTLKELRRFGNHFESTEKFALALSKDDNITDQDLQSLIERFPNITALSLCDNPITNEGLKYISQLDHLIALNLTNCQQITDAGLESLSSLHSLTHLDLTGCHQIKDVGIQHLSLLRNLTNLNLTFCYQIKNSGFQCLSQLYNLVHLNLSACSITDDGLQHLSHLRNLKNLNLASCAITDSGLNQLSRLSNLVNLNLSGCRKVTDEGIQVLQQKLPNLNIVR